MPVTSEGLHRKLELEGITSGLGSPKEVLLDYSMQQHDGEGYHTRPLLRGA